ncbi:TldD/PmbA family protein [candidate division KSB1 bacterium]|nr:TldD/PmbA family protein [candidate division KSB1 bacterium]
MGRKINRRVFIHHTSTGLAATAAFPALLTNSGKVFAEPGEKEISLDDYYQMFGVDEKTIQEVMAAALSHGGDYCDLYFERSIYNSASLEDNLVNRAYSDIDFGVGIRVLKGDQTGYSFTEEITPQAMKLAATTAANIADSKNILKPSKLEFHPTPDYYPIRTKWLDVSIDARIPVLKDINARTFAADSRVIKANVSFSSISKYVLIVTSEGRVTVDDRPMGRVGVSVIAEQNGQREQNGYSISGRYGMEYLTEENIARMVNEAVSKTVLLFDAVKPEAGEMPVVLAAGSSGILLHEAIGHGMEADFNRKKVSIFSDKINKPVAENFVSIVDDGTNLNARGSINVDDEANDVEKTYLVENGILRTYLHDRISASYYKVKPTGNGRRESFRHVPMPRMRNTYMLPGPHKKEEIIASVKNGLYAESFTNGEVFIGAGDFTFYVKSGYLIEDGKLTKPVKDINIIGNGPQVLKDIVMVADDFQIDEGSWTCGKNGQGVPVSLGLPTVKVSKITVGGVNS